LGSFINYKTERIMKHKICLSMAIIMKIYANGIVVTG
jgi:hypothetical protein